MKTYRELNLNTILIAWAKDMFLSSDTESTEKSFNQYGFSFDLSKVKFKNQPLLLTNLTTKGISEKAEITLKDVYCETFKNITLMTQIEPMLYEHTMEATACITLSNALVVSNELKLVLEIPEEIVKPAGFGTNFIIKKKGQQEFKKCQKWKIYKPIEVLPGQEIKAVVCLQEATHSFQFELKTEIAGRVQCNVTDPLKEDVLVKVLCGKIEEIIKHYAKDDAAVVYVNEDRVVLKSDRDFTLTYGESCE